MFANLLVPVAIAAGVLVLVFLVLAGNMVRYIPNDRVGIVEKK